MIDHERTKKRIREYLRVCRKYASSFGWFNREKNIQEIGITRIFMKELEKRGENFFQNLSTSPQDPPDVIAESLTGELIGIEVTEFVDEEVIREHQKGNNPFRFWTDSEIVNKLQGIIKNKDCKKFHGGPYDKTILLIHTDEPLLDYEKFETHISQHCFEKTRTIDVGYLFFSYSPKLKCYPYIKLKIS